MPNTSLEYTSYLTPTGVEYFFDKDQDSFFLQEEGWGMPPINYLKTRGPDQQGETYVGYRLQPRIIQFIHHINACSRVKYYENRALLMDRFRPNYNTIGNYNPGKLKKVLPDGKIYYLDVYLQEGPKFNAHSQDRWEEWTVHEVFQFVAPNPIVYEATASTLNLTTGLVENHLVFPFTFRGSSYPQYSDMQFSTGVFSNSGSLTYAGNWLDYPNIAIVGPCSYPTITNTTTGDKIALNYSVISGQTIQIRLPYGNKSVKDEVAGIDLIGALSSDSDLSTFHIAPHPEATSGSNSFVFTGSGGVAGVTYVAIVYYNRYIGI